jgi:trans-aconitate methyltransferase
MKSRQAYWQKVFVDKPLEKMSWYQDVPNPSLGLVAALAPSQTSPIIDIGGGGSLLADHLIKNGFTDVSVLDLSSTALAKARARIPGSALRLITADVTSWSPARRYEVWHDRATFHFLVTDADRAAYVTRLSDALQPGGHVVVGTFAPDGPETCSNLPVQRYDAASLADALGSELSVVHAERHLHRTPAGQEQPFQFVVLRRRG